MVKEPSSVQEVLQDQDSQQFPISLKQVLGKWILLVVHLMKACGPRYMDRPCRTSTTTVHLPNTECFSFSEHALQATGHFLSLDLSLLDVCLLGFTR